MLMYSDVNLTRCDLKTCKDCQTIKIFRRFLVKPDTSFKGRQLSKSNTCMILPV